MWLVKVMYNFIALLFLAGVSAQAQGLLQTFGSGTNQFQIQFVTIGNPGNAAYTSGNPNPVGSVGYVYNIGKYEVSRDMINKANTAGSLGITMKDMTPYGGNGVNRPASGITWYEALKFVNYLNTSQNYQAAYNFDGNGNLLNWNAGQYSGNNQWRHKDAFYFLPSQNEWFKAGYGAPDGSWYTYATGSNTAPTATSGGTNANTVVFGQIGPADVDNAGGLSAFGTMAQNGNVNEWTETAFDGVNSTPGENVSLRGGAYNDPAAFVFTPSNNMNMPIGGDAEQIGFRVASVPEPSALSLMLVGFGGLVWLRRKNRRPN